jgi:hypothetical protein
MRIICDSIFVLCGYHEQKKRRTMVYVVDVGEEGEAKGRSSKFNDLLYYASIDASLAD